jgi:hypothetical protein
MSKARVIPTPEDFEPTCPECGAEGVEAYEAVDPDASCIYTECAPCDDCDPDEG